MNGNFLRRSAALLLAVLLLLTMLPASASNAFKAKATSSARAYISRSTSSKSIKVGGAAVTVKAVWKGWAKVKVKGKTAYMKIGSLRPAESSVKKNIVSLALLQLGKSYGSGAPGRFNCSSLVRYCFGKYGYKMKGTAAEQAKDGRYKLIKSVSSIKYGDILFFDTSENGKVDHTGIYIGGGKYIEASSGAKRVRINRLDTWYRKHFVCARRI